MRSALIEKIKVVIIVVLFITTILLLYLLWSPGGRGIGFSGFGGRSTSSDAPTGAGLLRAEYSFSSAVGLFNSVVNFVLVFAANSLCRKASGSSLW